MVDQGRILADITPSPVLFLPAAMSVAEAAELMSKARTDAGLVESQDGSLVGILTDSDVSIKIAASGRSLRKTTVAEAMTANPLCVREHERADKALALMVEKRARHLPLLDANGGLSGMLDIAKVLFDAITRLEKTKDATENAFFPAMNRMAGISGECGVPTLSEALEGRPGPAAARPEDPIDVAFSGLRRTRRSVLVLDEAGKLVGILSKSDVAKRALRAALGVDEDETKALNRLKVRDVMTPRPDFIGSNRTVLDALHKMHDGKYANLPIVDLATDDPVGVVDVLDLLRAAMPKKMPSLLEGFFAAPRAGTDESNARAAHLYDATTTATTATTTRSAPERVVVDDSDVLRHAAPVATAQTPDNGDDLVVAEAVELSLAAEHLPRRNTVHCAISPSALKHSNGSSSLVPDFSFEITLPQVGHRLVVKGDARYDALASTALDRLAPFGALRVQFDYSDALARLRVVNDDTLRAATQLRLSIDPSATLVPLTASVVKRKHGTLIFATNLLVLSAVAAVLAFAVTKAPVRK
ncbi:hypothetical protein CTAYLR_010199 [Chrysophaeum taylorii]|uniref:CBS domain-containing protein n=1 Tax=Chrysophaeum taylorii TaxID=2483200 RepID=A0AAD7UCV4_9STRA|nr:hypothetical protein CTAYLR_010199 [Chrysophaeum taylorii]